MRDLAFVRDGFSFLAFLLPPLWLLWHRLWIEAVLAFAVLMLGRRPRTADRLCRAPCRCWSRSSSASKATACGSRRSGGAAGATVVSSTPTRLDDAETRYAAQTAADEELAPDRTPMRPSANIAGASPALGEPVGLLLNPGR